MGLAFNFLEVGWGFFGFGGECEVLCIYLWLGRSVKEGGVISRLILFFFVGFGLGY